MSDLKPKEQCGTTGPKKPVGKPIAQGWQCPVCGTVNAPWKSTCNCKKRKRLDVRPQWQ